MFLVLLSTIVWCKCTKNTHRHKLLFKFFKRLFQLLLIDDSVDEVSSYHRRLKVYKTVFSNSRYLYVLYIIIVLIYLICVAHKTLIYENFKFY